MSLKAVSVVFMAAVLAQAACVAIKDLKLDGLYGENIGYGKYYDGLGEKNSYGKHHDEHYGYGGYADKYGYGDYVVEYPVFAEYPAHIEYPVHGGYKGDYYGYPVVEIANSKHHAIAEATPHRAIADATSDKFGPDFKSYSSHKY